MIAEFAAFRARVESVPTLAVFDTQIEPGEERPPLYVVLFDQTPRDALYALDARSKQSIHTYPLMAVGSSPGEVRWVIGQVSGALRRHRLVVGERKSTPLRKISSSQINPDKAATVQPSYTATDVWRCAFDRA